MDFRVRGYYLESCNCEAICPCRTVGGVAGGRSTSGVCEGLLAWRIDEGDVGGTDVSGLNVALVLHYDDDEPGSPWTIRLHLDARAGPAQHAALEQLFLDGLGGPHTSRLPWIRKERHLVGVETSEIEVVDGAVRVGSRIRLRATRPVETDQPVACVIPGYDHVGRELYADELAVEDDPFSWALEGNCAYTSDFDYASA